MDIKVAKDEKDSKTLNTAKKSDNLLLGLIVGSFALTGVWIFVPKEIKEKMAPVFATGTVVVGFVLKNFGTSIKNGRLEVGDLNSAISQYALIKPGEAAALSMLKPVIEGNLNLHELPAVREEIEKQVQQRVGQSFNQSEFEEKIFSKFDQFKPVVFPANPPKTDMHEQVAALAKAQSSRSLKPEEVI
jgi:hypothetical protein